MASTPSVARKLDYSLVESPGAKSSDPPVSTPNPSSFDAPPFSFPAQTPAAASAKKFASRTPANTVNTGLGTEERRLQLWRPPALLLSDQTTSLSAFAGTQPARRFDASPAAQAYSPSKLPFVGESTQRSDFPGHVPSPRAPPESLSQPSPSKLPLTGTSEARSAFPGHFSPGRPAASSATAAPSPSKIPFAGSSTQRSDYPGHIPSPRAETAASPYSPAKLPFSGQSTTKTSFPGHVPSPQAAADASAPAASPAKLPVLGASEARSAYPGHFSPGRISAVPATAAEPRGSLPFTGTSTSRSAFQGAQPAYKPTPSKAYFEGDSARARLPFAGESEAHAKFAGWKLPERRPALGIEMFGDVFFEMIPASVEGQPVHHTQTFTTCADNQSVVEVRVLQQTDPASSAASRATLLGSFELVGIPPAAAAEAQIAVTFSIRDNLLHVSALDVLSGAKQVIAIDRRANSGAFHAG